jgi:hypothetical protein
MRFLSTKEEKISANHEKVCKWMLAGWETL